MMRRIISTALVFLCSMVVVALSQQKDEKDQTKSTKTEEPKKVEKETAKTADIVVMETSMGTIELRLFRSDAPKTVENFIGLARKGYYNGIVFHRVIDKFMIQGGDPTGTGMGGESIYGQKFEDEISPNLKFDREGLLAMANAGPNTNGSQFFITLAPTPWLNGHHTIFGEVSSGMDVIKAIGNVQTTKPGDRPVKPIVMKKVSVKGAKEVKKPAEPKTQNENK